MFGKTTRQRLIVVAAAALGLALVVTSTLAQWRMAFALTGTVLAATLIVLLDVRWRAGRLVLMPSEQRTLKAAIDDLWAKSVQLGELASSLSRVESAMRSQGEQLASSHRDVMTQLHQQACDVAALLQLYAKVTPRAPMPSTGPWAPRAPDLLQLFSLVERQRPALVLELGSGASTVWLGYALNNSGNGRLVSVDHLEEFAERTRDIVELHELGTSTEVRLAPLKAVQLGDKSTYHWYDQTTLIDLEQIDMIFIDGPPGGTRPEARFPALPMLLDRLADGALIVLAGVDEADQQKVVERWLAEITGLEREPETVGTYELLRYHRTPAGR